MKPMPMSLPQSLRIMALLGVLGGCSQSPLAVPDLSARSDLRERADLAVPPDLAVPDLAPLPCTKIPINVSDSAAIASASAAGSCTGAMGLQPWGKGAANSKCAGPLDCAPTCCTCTTAGTSALVSWCNAGVCAPPDGTCCAIAGTPTQSCP